MPADIVRSGIPPVLWVVLLGLQLRAEPGAWALGRLSQTIDVDRLKKAPKRPSTWFRPQLESKKYDPQGARDADSKEVGRHEQPSLGDQQERWAKR